jgi:hypothetical protein
MPFEPRSDRLDRGELLLWQRRALRAWCESDWLAEHDPVAWRACDETDPGHVSVCVATSERIEEQDPGCIVIGRLEPVDATPMPVSMKMDHDGRRPLDLYWDVADGLPCEDRTVDALYVPGALLNERLVKHAARVLRVGGTLTVSGKVDGDEVTEHGFDEEDLRPDGRRRFTLTQGKTSLAEAAPLTVDERNMGDRVIREPRQPYRR